MAHQVVNNNIDLYHNILDHDNDLHQQHNGWDNCTDIQTILIFVITLLLLFNKALKDGKLFSISVKNKNRREVVKAKLLLPVRLPVVDSIYSMVKLRNDGLQFHERLFEKYGNLYEIPFGPITVTVVSDPVIIHKVLSSAQMVYLNRPKVYNSIFEDLFHNGLLTSENEIWSAQRKMVARSFTYKSLQNFAVFMNKHAANLTDKLIQECENKKGPEIQRINQLISIHAFKIISQIVMGTDSIPSDESMEVAENFNRAKDFAQEKLLNPWKYLWLLPKRKEYHGICKYLNTFFVKMTQKYKQEYEETKRNSFSQKSSDLVKKRDTEDEEVGVKPFRCMIEEMICSGASDDEIYQQVGTILAAGHDTTTIAIKLLMLHLAKNPDHQVACRKEVDQVIKKTEGKNSSWNCSKAIEPFDLKIEDLHDLKYLERCISESGRLTSIIPLFLRRIDAPLKIDDELEFPAGTNFAISNWTLHRDPQFYPDPLKFDPDRFLSENVKKRHPYSYTAFSMGPRNCIGSKVAYMEIKVIMAHILHHFEIFSDDKFENVKLHFGVTIVPERDYNIVLKRRKQPNL